VNRESINHPSLLIDVGNSSIKWATYLASELSDMSQLLHTDENVFKNINQQWLSLEQPSAVYISCVAEDEVLTRIVELCNKLWDIAPQVIQSKKQQLGLINAYKAPLELGSDRWCAMLGAWCLSRKGFVVINAGSALTIDIVNQSGEHIGGYILPGINMMKKSLGQQTAKIAAPANIEASIAISLGKSTNECINAAVHLSTINFISQVIEQHKEPYSTECYLSGGDAIKLGKLLDINYTLMPDLVLRGMACIINNAT